VIFTYYDSVQVYRKKHDNICTTGGERLPNMSKEILLLLILWFSGSLALKYQVGLRRMQYRQCTMMHMETESVPFNPTIGMKSRVGSIISSLSSALLVTTAFVTQYPKKVEALDIAQNSKIVVLGAGGKTGQLIVQNMISENLGKFVRPVYRGKPQAFGESTNVEVASGDVTKIETLEGCIKGASAVIFAASASKNGGNAKAVDNVGVENVAKECVRLNVPRLVVISSGAITKPQSLGFKITNLFGNIMNEKLAGENSLIETYKNASPQQSYVIIRPGGLTDGSPLGASGMELNQGDTISGEVNRSDVALAALAAATSKTLESKSVIFELYRKGSGGPLESRFPTKSGYEQTGTSYEEMFKGLKGGKLDVL